MAIVIMFNAMASISAVSSALSADKMTMQIKIVISLVVILFFMIFWLWASHKKKSLRRGGAVQDLHKKIWREHATKKGVGGTSAEP